MRRGVVLAVAAGLVLAGCGDVSPGAAATVDGTTISMDRVDDIAQSYCAALVANAALVKQAWQPTPSAVFRDDMLEQLINEQLALEAADELGIDVPPSSYQFGDNSRLNDLLEQMPADDLEPFQDYLDSYGRLQALYSAIGADQAESDADDPQAALAAGQEYVREFAKERDIEVDPRFGEFTAGQVTGGSGSLSVAAEPTTKPTSTDDPPDVSGLPESQICQ